MKVIDPEGPPLGAVAPARAVREPALKWAECMAPGDHNCRYYGVCFARAMAHVCSEHAACCSADAHRRCTRKPNAADGRQCLAAVCPWQDVTKTLQNL